MCPATLTNAAPTSITWRWVSVALAPLKHSLVQYGISDSLIETVSYGEERPVAQGSDEGAYAQNRRAEFEITAGGQTLRKP